MLAGDLGRVLPEQLEAVQTRPYNYILPICVKLPGFALLFPA